MTLSLLLVLLQSHEHSTVVTFGTLDTLRWPADLDAGEGDVAFTSLRAWGELFQRLDRGNILRAAGGVERFRYDWSGREGLPEDLSAYRLEATYLHAFDARWKGVAQMSSAFQFEAGADVADGGAYGAGAGVLYQSSPRLTVGAALRVFTRIEDRPLVALLPYFEWKPSPAWSLRTEAREGAGLELTRALDDAAVWSLQARVAYQERRFRLDGEGQRPEGVFQDARLSLMAGIRWQPVRGVSASLALGLDVHQRFTLEDSRGRRSSEFESEPAPLLGLYVSSSF
jgi:hypothetical protein